MVDRRVSIYNTATLLTSARSGRELVHGKPRRHDVRRILLVVQDHNEERTLMAKVNIACTYCRLDQDDIALGLYREVYAGFKRLKGASDSRTVDAAVNFVNALGKSGHFAEAKALLREQIPNMRQLGPDHEKTLSLRHLLAMCLFDDKNATEADFKEALAILEDVERRYRRVLGDSHPLTTKIQSVLEATRN